MRTVANSGFALLFCLGMLALIAVLAVTAVQMTSLDRALSTTYVMRTWARLAAESGVDYALARLADVQGGPVPEPLFRELGMDGNATVSNRIELQSDAAGGVARGYTVRVRDESGALNLNDPDSTWSGGEAPVRLRRIVSELTVALFGDAALASRATDALFVAPETARGRYPGDQFPDLAAVERALTAAGLSDEQRGMFLACVTVHSWRDPDVLKPGGAIFGKDLSGIPPAEKPDEIVSRWLEFQTKDFALEARAPVNVNTARPELIRALLRPLQGVYLEEGPAENQSSEHYGWWSTGLGSPDPNVNKMGVIRVTRELSEEQVKRLATAMHDRIHGTRNDDLAGDQQTDADGDGVTDPNPFETWEEFRHFLQSGLRGSDTLTSDTPAYAVWVGGDFNMDPREWGPVSYFDTHRNWIDSHAVATTPPIANFRDEWRSNWSPCPVDLSWAENAEAEIRAWYTRYTVRFLQDMVYANANPNSLLNDWNPNANVYVGVDKAQLTRYTTEFCFEPTGAFGIDADGSVTSADGRLLAACSLRTVIQPFAVLRQTTQAQFLDGLSRTDPARTLDKYFGAGGNTHRNPGGLRTQLQSYPEPYLGVIGADDAIARSRYDGQIQAATLESYASFKLSAAGFFNGTMDQPLNLNMCGFSSGGAIGAGMDPRPNLTDANRPHAGALTGARESETPGVVFPDGCYSEAGRVLAYRIGNFNQDRLRDQRGLQGALVFWIKPNFHMGVSSRIRKLVSGPSQPGTFARQQWGVLYYFCNPNSNEEDGCQSTLVPDRQRIAMRPRILWPNQGGWYGLRARNYWVNTRSLGFGFAWQPKDSLQKFNDFMQTSMTSMCVNRDYPLAGRVTPRSTVQGPMDTHHWSTVQISWNLTPAGADSKINLTMYVNAVQLGCSVPNGTNYRKESTNHYLPWDRQNTAQRFTDNLNMEWFRFGELPQGAGADYATPESSPYQADSTIDDLQLFSEDGYQFSQSTWNAGRYLRYASTVGGQPCLGVYTSPEIAVADRLQAGGPVRLRSVAWTYYRPQSGRSKDVAQVFWNKYRGVRVNSNDRPDPMAAYWAPDDLAVTKAEKLTWDPIAVDFRTAAGAWNFEQTGLANRFTYAGGSQWTGDTARGTYAPGQSFRYKVCFHLLNGAEALYESPVLDDVTTTWWLPRPRILSWREL